MNAIVVHFRAIAGHIEQAREAAKENAATSLELEPGCLRFDVVELDEPGWFMFVEYYSDAAAVEAHLRLEHYRRWRMAVDLHIDPASMVKFTGALGNSDVELLRDAKPVQS